MPSPLYQDFERAADEGDNLDAFLADLQNDRRNRRVARAKEAQEQAIVKAMRVIKIAEASSRGEQIIREAFDTPDFPLAFNWFTDRMILMRYAETPARWDQYFKRSTVPDFRPAARDRLIGLDSVMSTIAEAEEYKHTQNLTGSRDQTLKVSKYGQTFKISLESQVNDVLGQLQDIPVRLARAARRTEQYQAAAAYVANATLYTGGQGNKVTSKLSVDSLTTAYNFLVAQKDANGNPIYLGATFRLVVAPGMQLLAERIVKATNLIFDTNPSAGTPKTRYETANYLTSRFQVEVDYFMPILDPTNGATSWYLFADPAELPVGEVAFLRSDPQPVLYVKTPNAIRVSEAGALGGAQNPMDGSFEDDTISYKVRHIVGATTYEYRATYWSDGSGS